MIQAGRHRVLAAPAVESLRPPIGEPNEYALVVSAQFIKERLDAITLG